MIRLIVLVAAMVAGLIFGPQASGNKGYVLISLGNYTVESSVTSAVILAVLFYGALLIVEWLLGRVFGLRRKTLGWYGSRRRRKANQQTVAATLAMAEGHYSQAEKLMLKGASNSDTPLLNYLSAAKAAQARGDDVRRDQYLQKAQEENPKAELALTLTQTQLQIEQGQYDTALAMLESVYALNPRHPMVLDQLRQVHLAREDWAALIDLIPVLHKVGKLTPNRKRICCSRPGVVASTPPAAPRDPAPDLAGAAAQAAPGSGSAGRLWRSPAPAGADNEAAELWLDALRKQVSPQLLARLPKLKLDSYQPMLTLLQKIQDQPGVDAALAQVYLLAGQLDDAQRLLEQEVAKAPNAAVYHALGQVMDKRRLTNKANEYYRQALQLADV